MKRLQNILRVTLMLALAMAPLGGVYADIGNQADMKSQCPHMNMEDGKPCPHHNAGDNSQNSGMDKKCDKDCNDCKATNHVASLSNCPLHTGRLGATTSDTHGSTQHACPHQNTTHPPKH